MISGLFNSGSMPVLERMVQFTSARHTLILDNVANLSTPYYRPRDLSVESFQQTLAKAVELRRQRTGGPNGDLTPSDTQEIRFHRGSLAAKPQPTNDNILFHDGNNRSFEHTMKTLAENSLAHNAALQLLKNQFDMIQSAIRGQA